jgi:hypothetical protein
MPAKKPASLIKRHETAAERQTRAKNEAALRPGRGLPVSAPAVLKGHAVAVRTWRAALRMYSDLEGEIVTRLDFDQLVDYCMLVQHLSEIDHMREMAYQAWLELAKEHDRLLEVELVDEAVLMAIKVVGAFDAITRLDTRAERKRALLKQYRESLYLTPRSRAGTAPDKKAPPEPTDEFEQLLDEASDTTSWKSGE